MAEDEQPLLATQVALLRRDFENMSADIAEIKDDFKDFKRFYYTKEEAAYLKTEWKTAHNQVVSEMREWKRFVISVAIIVVAAAILALLRIPHVGG